MSRWLLLASLAASVLLVTFASTVLRLATGNDERGLVRLLSWMAWIPLLIGLNMSSYQQLLAHQQNRSYTVVLIAAAVGSIVLNLLLAPVYGAPGTALSVLLAEVVIAFGLLYATEVKYGHLAVWRRRS